MITLSRLYGQTSNNFIQHIHIDAFCRSNGLKFNNPLISQYYDTYPNLRKGNYGRSRIIMKIRKALVFKRRIRFDSEDQQSAYNQALLQGGNVFCEGWHFRTPNEVISRFMPIYRDYFTPNFDTRSLEEAFLQTPEGEILLAVHIRRGDYKEWLDGKFYFEDDVYIDKIHQVLEQLGQPAKIILFSNDPNLNYGVYQQAFGNVLRSENSVAADHFLMSKCDYIIGPPSTFTMWASLIGETQFLHFHSKDDIIQTDRFRIFKGNG